MGITQKQRQALHEANKESNRVTRESIQQALFLLADEKGYEEISITEIIRKSGVSRSAFYRNYYSKKDIIVDFYKTVRAEFNEVAGSNLNENWRVVFGIVRKNAETFRTLKRVGLSHIVLDQFNSTLSSDDTDYRMVLWYGMIYNAIFAWIDTDMHEDDDEIAAKIMESMYAVAQTLTRDTSATN